MAIMGKDKNPEEKGCKGLDYPFSRVVGEEVRFEVRRDIHLVKRVVFKDFYFS